MRWISVKDRLPEFDGFVLYCGHGVDGNIEVDTCTTEWFLDYIERMTHWMPLPEPPKE